MLLERFLLYWPPGSSAPMPVTIRFGLPQPHELGWACDIIIDGFPDNPHEVSQMFGVDPLDALIATLSTALILLRRKEGRLTWGSSEDLHFPRIGSEPWQEWRFTPVSGASPQTLTIRVLHPERIEGNWSVLIRLVEHKTWKSWETRFQAATWPQALERAAAGIPVLLEEYVLNHGGGTLEEVNDPPLCSVSEST